MRVRRDLNAGDAHSATAPYEVACERVLRYLRVASYGRGGRRVRIHASRDHGTHWLLTFAVQSVEDPSRIFMYADIVAEKGTGDIYRFPSRTQHPIDKADIASIRRGCSRTTPDDLARLES